MFDVLAHRAADDDDLAARVDADVDRLLHAVDVRGEARRRGCGPCGAGMIWRNASPTTRSEPRDAGALGVRRVAEQQVDAAVAELGEPADVGAQAVDRRVVELVVAGVEDAPARRLEHDRRPRPGSSAPCGRTRCGTARARSASPSGSTSRSSAARSRPCSSSFDLTRPSVSRVAQISATRASRIRYGSAPTWSSCPCVSTTRADRRSRSRRYAKSGRIEVDAEVLVAREREPGVDRRRSSPSASKTVMFLPDLAEAAERDDLGASGHRPSVGRVVGLTGPRVEPDTRLMRLSFLAYATVAAGLGVTVAGAFAAAGRPLTALALLRRGRARRRAARGARERPDRASRSGRESSASPRASSSRR